MAAYGMERNFLPQSVQTLTPESVDFSHLQKRQALADALMRSAMTPIDTNNRKSGRFVSAVSPFEGMAKLAEAYIGAKQHNAIEQQTRDLANEQRQRLIDSLTDQESIAPQERPSESLGAPYNAEAYDTKTPNPYNVPGATAPQWMDPTRPVSGLQANSVEVRGQLPQEQPQQQAPDRMAIVRNLAVQMLKRGASQTAVEQFLMNAQLKDMEQQFKSMEPVKLGEGDQMVDPSTGRVLASGAPKDRSFTAGSVRYAPDGTQVAGQFTRREGSKEVTYEIRNGVPVKVAEGPAFNPNPLIQMNNGLTTIADANSPTGASYIRQGDAAGKPAPATSVNKPSDGEQMAKGYHDRMVAAEKLLGGIGDKGYPTEKMNSAASVPLVGDYLKRKASTADQQKYEQAQRDWVRSKLRKESGAVIGEQEMKDEIRTYFPQPGDTPEVIAQKEQARQVAIQAMRDAAGPALGKTPAAQPKKDGNLSTDEQRELMELRKRFKK